VPLLNPKFACKRSANLCELRVRGPSVSILRFAAIRPAPSHANFGIKSKAKLANILMLVRFLGLGSADRATGELQTRASPIGSAGVSPLVMASGPATITFSAALQLLAVLMLPWRIGCGWQ
jgi:hypothetical protein